MQLISSTGMLRSSKLVHLHGKTLASFTRNLVQKFNEFNLFFLQTTGRGIKITKTKVFQKDTNRRRSETKG